MTRGLFLIAEKQPVFDEHAIRRPLRIIGGDRAGVAEELGSARTPLQRAAERDQNSPRFDARSHLGVDRLEAAAKRGRGPGRRPVSSNSEWPAGGRSGPGTAGSTAQSRGVRIGRGWRLEPCGGRTAGRAPARDRSTGKPRARPSKSIRFMARMRQLAVPPSSRLSPARSGGIRPFPPSPPRHCKP